MCINRILVNQNFIGKGGPYIVLPVISYVAPYHLEVWKQLSAQTTRSCESRNVFKERFFGLPRSSLLN